MKKRYFLVLFFIIILCSFSILDVFFKKTYVYNDITGHKSSKTTWLIKKKKDLFVIDKIAKDALTNLVYSSAFFLEKYHFSSTANNIDYTLSLDSKTLVAQGLIKGKKFFKKIYLDGEWIQDFNFGFKNFLNSQYLEKRFVIVNPNDFSSFEMRAFKKEIEKIQINNTTYKTQKVVVSLTGFKSAFWKAYIWYDLDTFDLVQYKANEGPGTPVTTISLDSRE